MHHFLTLHLDLARLAGLLEEVDATLLHPSLAVTIRHHLAIARLHLRSRLLRRPRMFHLLACIPHAWPNLDLHPSRPTTPRTVEPATLYRPQHLQVALDLADYPPVRLQALRLLVLHPLVQLDQSVSVVIANAQTSTQHFKVPAPVLMVAVRAHHSVVQREAQATQRLRLLVRCLLVLLWIRRRVAMDHQTSLISLHVARKIAMLGSDATTMIAANLDSAAADTQAESAEVMMRHLAEVLPKQWTTAEILRVERTGDLAMTAMVGKDNATDALDGRTSTLAVRSPMSRAHSAVVQCKVSRRHRRHLPDHHLNLNGSVALRAAMPSSSTAGAVAGEQTSEAVEARDVKMTGVEAVDLVVRMI